MYDNKRRHENRKLVTARVLPNASTTNSRSSFCEGRSYEVARAVVHQSDQRWPSGSPYIAIQWQAVLCCMDDRQRTVARYRLCMEGCQIGDGLRDVVTMMVVDERPLVANRQLGGRMGNDAFDYA